jgi:ATP-dependent protease ClpP protease subunit
MNPQAKAPKNSWFSMKAGIKNAGDADITIYDEIGGWGVTAQQFSSDLKSLGDINHINLHIHSPGGDVFEGTAIYNLLANHPAKITVYIDGLAASMASVIAMAGDTIIMPENAMMMIHKPWGIQGGDADQLRKYADLLDTVEKTLVASYAKKTGLSETEIHSLLADETWMTGVEAVIKGFADQTTKPLQAAAQLNSNRMKDFKNMPKELEALIAPKAAAQTATEKTAPVVENKQPETVSASVSESEIRAKIQLENKQRLSGIQNVFANFGGRYSELMQECLADADCTVENAKDKVLSALGKSTTPTHKETATTAHAGNGNIVGDSVRASIFARAGFADAEVGNAYNHMTLRELARASLHDRGVGVSALNPMQMVGMAFTHGNSDFGSILLDVAHKSLLQGWDEANETFEQWTKKGQLSDFKTSHRVGLETFPTLREVRPGAEYKYATLSDRGEQIALATYGELFSINRQAIINDDLQALMDIPMKMGMAAKATIGDLVYAILTASPKLSDGVSLFHANHKNLATGAPSIATLDAARQLMRTQKSGNRNLNIRPEFVLAPTALESTLNQVIRSSSVKGTDANSGVSNPLQNFATVIGEPRLDDASAVEWYLAAGAGRDTIEVAYLNGIDTPYIDQQQGFTTDGVATKVRIDAGVAPLDHRGLVKSSGV